MLLLFSQNSLVLQLLCIFALAESFLLVEERSPQLLFRDNALPDELLGFGKFSATLGEDGVRRFNLSGCGFKLLVHNPVAEFKLPV